MKPLPGRAALQTLALVAASLLVALLFGEGLLRAIGYRYKPLKIQAGVHDQRAHHAFEDNLFVYDPELLWRPRKRFDLFNAQGLRGPVLAMPKPKGEFRIIAIGDSNTLGWGGYGGSNWPGFLAELLARPGGRVVVANAGVWGYASFQGVRRLRECLSFDPDLVLISFGSNDAHLVTVPDRLFAERRGSRGGGFSRRLLGSRLVQLWMTSMDRVQAGRDEARRERGVLTPRVSLDEYRQNLVEMVGLAREHGTRIVLLTRPYIGESLRPMWWKLRGADYNTATVEVAARYGVPAIDVYSHFRDREGLFADESHFTDDGHRIAAALIAQQLSPYVD